MRWLNRLVRKNVVVHMASGVSLRGVLVGVYADSMVLVHAEWLSADAVTPVDGEAVIPRSNVAWVQILEAGL